MDNENCLRQTGAQYPLTVDARPMVYNEKLRKWGPCSTGLCNLSIYYKPGVLHLRCDRKLSPPMSPTSSSTGNEPFTNADKLILEETISVKQNNVIGNGTALLKFHRATMHFFQWRSLCNGRVYGMHFIDPDNCDLLNQLFCEIAHQYQTIDCGLNESESTDEGLQPVTACTNQNVMSNNHHNSYQILDLNSDQSASGYCISNSRSNISNDSLRMSGLPSGRNEALSSLNPTGSSRMQQTTINNEVNSEQCSAHLDSPPPPPPPPIPLSFSSRASTAVRPTARSHQRTSATVTTTTQQTRGKPPLPESSNNILTVNNSKVVQHNTTIDSQWKTTEVEDNTLHSAAAERGVNNFMLEIQQRIGKLKEKAERNSTVTIGHANRDGDRNQKFSSVQIGKQCPQFSDHKIGDVKAPVEDDLQMTDRLSSQPLQLSTPEVHSNNVDDAVVYSSFSSSEQSQKVDVPTIRSLLAPNGASGPNELSQLRSLLERWKMEIVDSVVNQLKVEMTTMKSDIIRSVLQSLTDNKQPDSQPDSTKKFFNYHQHNNGFC